MKPYGLALIAMVGTSVMAAQQQQPPPRPVDATPPGSAQSLPAIDLPEFVITGSASINPPDVSKDLHDEDLVYRKTPDATPGPRDRTTVDLGTRFKQSLLTSPQGLYGIVGADLGTFFTGNVFGAFGTSTSSHGILGEARYSRTRGFMRSTDASSGMIGVRGSMIVGSDWPMLDRARIGSGISYELSKYRFYGSTTPEIQRDWSLFRFHADGATSADAPALLTTGLGYQSFGISDSSAETTENRFSLNATAVVPVFDFPVSVGAGVTLSTVTAASSSNLSVVSLSAGVPPLTWSDVVLEVSVTASLIKGMAGQNSGYFLPHLRARFTGIESQTLFLGFHPEVAGATLERHILAHPYLSANTILRHEIHRWRVSGGVESEWGGGLRTKLELRNEGIDDYPLAADTAGTGIWTLWYGGRTTITTVKLDAVANIGTNDYFAVAFVGRSAENSIFGEDIPYLPAVETSVAYRYRFPFHVTVSPSVSFLGSRRAGAESNETVGSCFWSGVSIAYTGIAGLAVEATAQNVLNRRYEVWKGYRAEPFRLSLGLSYRW